MTSPHSTGFIANYLIGGLACCAGEICTLPLDMVKVRLQCDGSRSLKQTCSQIYHQGGIQSFWSGGSSALIRIFLYCGLRWGFYEAAKDGFGQRTGTNVPFYKKAVAACIAGASSAAICTPTDVVKTRMQAQDPRHKRYKGFIQATKAIARSEGVRGLYSAWIPTAGRAGVIAVTEIATYDEIKNRILCQGFQDGPATHLSASLCSGVISTFFAAPMDYLKTRMQAHPHRYRNAFECAFSSVRTSSLGVLWTGVIPHYLRRGPHLVITYLTLEQLRKVRLH
jgi:hypothetical protein